MRNIKLSLIILLLATIGSLNSCLKEEVKTTTVDPVDVEPIDEYFNGLISRARPESTNLQVGCLAIEYPFQMIFLDNTSLEIASDVDFNTALNNATSENPLIDYTYPLTVKDNAGGTQVINNADEFGELFINCIPDTGWEYFASNDFFPAWNINFSNSCFSLEYPLILVDIHSTAEIIANQDELLSTLCDGEIYGFGFPVMVKDDLGNSMTFESRSMFANFLKNCNSSFPLSIIGIGTFDCHEIAYPFEFVLENNVPKQVENINEFAQVFLEERWEDFNLPLRLIDPAGNATVSTNNSEVIGKLLECGDVGTAPIVVDIVCYLFTFPISVIDSNGSTVVVNDSFEWDDIRDSGYSKFIFPIELTHYDTGQKRTVNDEDELVVAIDDCF